MQYNIATMGVEQAAAGMVAGSLNVALLRVCGELEFQMFQCYDHSARTSTSSRTCLHPAS